MGTRREGNAGNRVQYTEIQRVQPGENHRGVGLPQAPRDDTPQAYDKSTIEIAGHDSESE